jgi:hypothetical protein
MSTAAQIWGAFLLGIVFLGTVLVVMFKGWRFRQNVNQLLSAGEVTGENLTPVTEAVAAVNARNPGYTFGVQRAASIAFRGHRIWFVLGDVGSFSPGYFGEGSWSRWGSLYAVADCQQQADWMATNSDAFSPAVGDSTFPVFWVKLWTIIANQHLQPTPR